MPLEVETQGFEEKLAAFCRSDVYQPIPGVRTDRVETYRRLIFHVVEETLSKAFPITRAALTDSEWHDLVHVFFETYDSSSPLLWRMPKGLLEFSKNNNWAERLERPWFDDLLRFEWLEIEVYMMPDTPVAPARERGDISRDSLIINPDHQIVRFDYPVFRTPSKQIKESDRGEYFLLAYRHPEQLNVCFVELDKQRYDLFLQLRDGRSLDEISGQRMDNGQSQQFVEALLVNRAAFGFS